MAEGVGESKYDVGSTVYVPYEGGTHYQARVRFFCSVLRAHLNAAHLETGSGS